MLLSSPSIPSCPHACHRTFSLYTTAKIHPKPSWKSPTSPIHVRGIIVKPDHHSYPHVSSCIPTAHSSLHHRGYSLSPLIPCMYLIPYHPCPHALTHYSPIFFLTFHYIIPIFSHHHPICLSSYPTHIHIPLNLSHSNKPYHLADYYGLCLSYCMDITISRCHFSQHDRKMLIGG